MNDSAVATNFFYNHRPAHPFFVEKMGTFFSRHQLAMHLIKISPAVALLGINMGHINLQTA